MSNTPNDCSAIEQRLNEHNLYISTTQDQLNKIDSNDVDAQEQREALIRKLDSLREELGQLQHALEDCRQGKATNFPSLDKIP